MVIIEMSEWLKPEEVSKDMEVAFLSPGEFVESEEYGSQFVIDVSFSKDGQAVKRKWRMNRTCQRSCAEKFGHDTEQWPGKVVKLWVDNTMVGSTKRQVIYVD